MSSKKLNLYYDGSCRVCDGEINHYKKVEKNDAIEYIDISSPNFDAQAHHLERKAIDRDLHVRLPNGEIKKGVDAFIEIWKTIPRYQFLVPICSFAPIRLTMKGGYFVFTYIRPFLPKKKGTS